MRKKKNNIIKNRNLERKKDILMYVDIIFCNTTISLILLFYLATKL